VDVAKKKASRDDAFVLSTGVRARIVPVSASLIDQVQFRIKNPPVPMWTNPDKPDRQEENPNDPAYLEALTDAAHRRSEAVMDAVIMFGAQLLDPIPPVDEWLPKLEYFLGMTVVRDNPFAIEFAYKKYVAIGAPDAAVLMGATNVTAEDVEAATRSFRRSA
jgi:hypothetical protein